MIDDELRRTERLRAALGAHGSTVFAIALRLLRDPGTAEEVAQDVFLEFDRAKEPFADEQHVRFWLRRVAVHRATDALRRRARQPESGAEMWAEETHGTNAGEGIQAVGNAVTRRLEAMVRSLPDAMRAAVVLRYSEDLTPEEISKLLGQPLPTVKSNLQRGLSLLRQKAAVVMKEYVRGQRA